jgi:sodium/hydrogen exchanger 8
MGLALGDPPADYASIASVGLFVALMCVCIIVGHLLEENRWMNESITALFIVSPTAPPFFSLLP